MEEPLLYEDPFASEHLWRLSRFTPALESESSIFGAPDTHLQPLKPVTDDSAATSHFAFALDLGDLDPQNLDPRADLQSPGGESPSQVQAIRGLHDRGDDNLPTFWDAEIRDPCPAELPSLNTWEAFEKTNVESPDSSNLCLSEAGPLAFDAALWTLRKTEPNIGVLPQDVVLRSLCNLVLGRASVLFQWNESKRTFEATLDKAPASGTSWTCYSSISGDLAAFGSSIRRLRSFAHPARNIDKQLATMLALQSSVSTMLEAIDECISSQLRGVRSILQLKTLIDRPKRLVDFLVDLTQMTRGLKTDEAVISSVSECVHLSMQVNPEYASMLQSLLARVSAPWLEYLGAEIGFGSSVALSSRVDAEPLLRGNASFVGSEDSKLLDEARTSLRLLREHAPDRGRLWSDSQKLAASITAWTEPATDAAPDIDLDQLNGESWSNDHLQTRLIYDTSALMSQDPMIRSGSQADHLHERVAAVLQPSSEEGDALHLDSNVTPLDRFRPFIKSQARLLNGLLLRRLFRDDNLLHHLELHRSFHLFGNGEFITRLSTALFSAEAQSAERKRGTMPTAGAIGLRLGSTHKQRWPPASSELQLSLMGILGEVYESSKASKSPHARQHTQLPGALNFAIRELPEAEIERTLHSSSIYALDFLRLQYQAPAPLDAVFTPDIMQKYDVIFRWLLQILRILHVTSTLQRNVSGRGEVHERLGRYSTSFAHQAHRFISVLLAHFMDIGIDTPWRNFLAAVKSVVRDLKSEDDNGVLVSVATTMSLEGLRELQEHCLERMRSRLFMKRKQLKFREALQDVLTAILAGSYDDRSPAPDMQTTMERLRGSISRYCKLLQDQADEPPKAMHAEDAEDVEANTLLLHRLQRNGKV